MQEKLDIKDTGEPVIEKAPTVELEFCSTQDGPIRITLKPGESYNHRVGSQRVDIELIKVNRPKPVPVMGPPYRFLIQCTDGYERVIRSMEESLAVKHFHRTEEVERTILDVFPITHLTS